MLVKEDLNNYLKPKDLVGKYFYVMSSTTLMPEFIVKILHQLQNHVNCKVIYNNFMIDGPFIFTLEEDENFRLTYEDFISLGFQELDHKPISQINGKIRDLEEFKEFYQKLLDEHNES